MADEVQADEVVPALLGDAPASPQGIEIPIQFAVQRFEQELANLTVQRTHMQIELEYLRSLCTQQQVELETLRAAAGVAGPPVVEDNRASRRRVARTTTKKP